MASTKKNRIFSRKRFKPVLSFVLIMLSSDCASTKLIRKEKGDVITSTENPISGTTTYEINTFDAKMSTAEFGPHVLMSIDERSAFNVKNKYKRLDVYEKNCSYWYSSKTCEFETGPFILLHLMLIGFLFDPIAIHESKGPIEVKVPKGTLSENQRLVRSTNKPANSFITSESKMVVPGCKLKIPLTVDADNTIKIPMKTLLQASNDKKCANFENSYIQVSSSKRAPITLLSITSAHDYLAGIHSGFCESNFRSSFSNRASIEVSDTFYDNTIKPKVDYYAKFGESCRSYSYDGTLDELKMNAVNFEKSIGSLINAEQERVANEQKLKDQAEMEEAMRPRTPEVALKEWMVLRGESESWQGVKTSWPCTYMGAKEFAGVVDSFYKSLCYVGNNADYPVLLDGSPGLMTKGWYQTSKKWEETWEQAGRIARGDILMFTGEFVSVSDDGSLYFKTLRVKKIGFTH